MRQLAWVSIAVVAVGCQSETLPVREPDLDEPKTFLTWPSITEKPVQIGPDLWTFCRASAIGPAEEAAARSHGPHSGRAVIVRVSPQGIVPFREGKLLPIGATVVKEKYADGNASGPLHEYAMMVKRAPGYDPSGGDWEYVYVTLNPKRSTTRGRLAECIGCHSAAKERDYLFRSYGSVTR
jgi:hypothetical protein